MSGSDVTAKTVTSDGLLLRKARIHEHMEATDVDAQDHTLTHGNIKKGIVVHTSVTSGGTVTTDTAANIIANLPLSANNESVKVYYINDGNQTLTFAGGTNVTVADTGNTIAQNESALLLFRRTGAAAVKLYIV